MSPVRMFNITSRPQPELNNRSFSVGLGCMVGGSSGVNGQVFLRGSKEEFDAWAELGGPGSTWNWDGLLPYFRKARTLYRGSRIIARSYRPS
jgi:choline dehydrogenase-like flavoprotein